MKKHFAILLSLVMVLSLFGCSAIKEKLPSSGEKQTAASEKETPSQTPDSEDKEETFPEDAPSPITDLDTLEEQVLFLLECGAKSAEEYYDRHAVYYYSTAAAHVTSLRFLTDNILWLKGEGETVADLSGEGLSNWYEIAALNYASPYPLYCQYLLAKMQGKSEEAGTFMEQAGHNPDCPTDNAFYDWKGKSVDELYEIREELEGMETAIFSHYSPNVTPLEELTGAEFFLDYHLSLAQVCLEAGDYNLALECAERGINTDPFSGMGYYFGALAALAMDDAELTAAYLNEGFRSEPTSVEINFLLASIAKSKGDTETMNQHLAIAKDQEMSEDMAKLIAALEGGSK